MKCILAFIYILGTTQAYFPDPCRVPCRQYQNFDPSSSAVLELSAYVKLVYSGESRLFFMDNTRDNMIFVPYGNIIYLIDAESMAFLAIDRRTSYAAKGVLDCDRNFRRDYSLLIQALFGVLSQYKSIDSSYQGSFDFNMLIRVVFSGAYDGGYNNGGNNNGCNMGSSNCLNVGNVGCSMGSSNCFNLGNGGFGNGGFGNGGFGNGGFNMGNNNGFDVYGGGQLDSFKRFLSLVQNGVSSGVVNPTRGIWGIFSASMGLDTDVSAGMIDLFRTYADYSDRPSPRFVSNVISRLSNGLNDVVPFANSLRKYVGITSTTDLDQASDFASNIRFQPHQLLLPIQGEQQQFDVSDFGPLQALRWREKAPAFNDREVSLECIPVADVVLMINRGSGIVLAIYQRYFALIHLISGQLLIGTTERDRIMTALVEDYELAYQLQYERYVDAYTRIVGNIVEYAGQAKINFADILQAYQRRDIAPISPFIGNDASISLLTNFRDYLTQCREPSIAGITQGIHANSKSHVAIGFAATLQSMLSSGVANYGNFNNFLGRDIFRQPENCGVISGNGGSCGNFQVQGSTESLFAQRIKQLFNTRQSIISSNPSGGHFDFGGLGHLIMGGGGGISKGFPFGEHLGGSNGNPFGGSFGRSRGLGRNLGFSGGISGNVLDAKDEVDNSDQNTNLGPSENVKGEGESSTAAKESSTSADSKNSELPTNVNASSEHPATVNNASNVEENTNAHSTNSSPADSYNNSKPLKHHLSVIVCFYEDLSIYKVGLWVDGRWYPLQTGDWLDIQDDERNAIPDAESSTTINKSSNVEENEDTNLTDADLRDAMYATPLPREQYPRLALFRSKKGQIRHISKRVLNHWYPLRATDWKEITFYLFTNKVQPDTQSSATADTSSKLSGNANGDSKNSGQFQADFNGQSSNSKREVVNSEFK